VEHCRPSHDRIRQALASYLVTSAAGHALWEILQIPLYTIFRDASPRGIAFALFHCTLGDILIAASTLGLACVVTRSMLWQADGRRALRVALVTLVLGVVYTMFSEWLNTGVRANWAYTAAMPILPVLGTGLAPLAQWLFVPALALSIARFAVTRCADRS
jgi:hypothetical protein